MATKIHRTRRALLFTPGDNAHRINKAAALGADAVILDLEDGVAMSQKTSARMTILEALKTVDFGRTERIVRINPVDSDFAMQDLAATLAAHPDAYLIPKVERREHVQWVSEQIAEAELRQRWPSGGIRLLALVETAKGIVNLKDIAASDERLDALVFGAEDLAGSMGLTRTPEGWEIFYARSAVAVHAAAYDLQAIDTIYAAYQDTPGLVAEARQALNMGYTGKMAIHPQQVAPINEVFMPSDEEIAQAQRLVEAYTAHQDSGTGAFALDGKMVDAPMMRAAERVLARVRKGG